MRDRGDGRQPARATAWARWSDASGKSSIRGLIALVLVVGGIYVGMKLIPVRASAFQFADAVTDQVTFAASRRATDSDIKDALVEFAGELGLPITAQDITVRRPTRRYIVVEVDYTVPVEFVGGYVFNWRFTPRAEGPLI